MGIGAVVILTAMVGGAWDLMVPWEFGFGPAMVVTRGVPGE